MSLNQLKLALSMSNSLLTNRTFFLLLILIEEEVFTSHRFVYCYHYFERGLLFLGFLISRFDPTFFVREMAEGKTGKRYTAKEAAYMIMNEDFGKWILPIRWTMNQLVRTMAFSTTGLLNTHVIFVFRHGKHLM